ncbi:MAG: DNA double-strand break repair nuclease NurA [Synechococcaceae cyanobacterium SM2_3_2]|nr:DNA double-strand break repair nuclease NurA [Synechococcaceae cyanobacterium SM2_3_2]
MPYGRETAGKGGHSDFVRNPDVQAFLGECEYMREPSEQEAAEMVKDFVAAPKGDPPQLPKFVVASDGSKSDEPISEKLPSTQIGFVKVSHVLILMDKYKELIDPQSRFVDPFKVAELHRSANPITFVLPGSNIKYKGATSVKDGFRRAVFDQLSTNRRDSANRFVLAEALVELSSGPIQLEKCPSCGGQVLDLAFTKTNLTHECLYCETTIYVTDWLRLHEGISDFGDNRGAMTRMMNAVEHLLMAALIQELWNKDLEALSHTAFVIDGPLALFGEPAKLHARIMDLIFRVNQALIKAKKEPLLVIGLQKSGAVMDHALLLNRFLPKGVYRVVDDDYRYSFITGSDNPAENFGSETYYGQDFLFKTERGRVFNFALPYPFRDKQHKAQFASEKVEPQRYGSLIERACDFIRHFELDLYDNAIVPVALAHRHASISLVPGGKVLDMLVKVGLSG